MEPALFDWFLISTPTLHERMNSPLQRRSLPTQAKALAHGGGLRRLAEGGAAKPTKVARGFNHCMGANLTLSYYYERVISWQF